jgi:hypothetical protein
MTRKLFSLLLLAGASANSQESADPKAALQQRLGQIRQSIAKNQAQLRQYSWVETTEISLKGEVKKREQHECRYGPDGKVQKVPVGDSTPAKKRRGIKGMIAENKIEDLKEYMDRVGSLVRRYVPPDPEAMQASFQAGKASVQPAGSAGAGSLVFRDYAKPGDTMTLTLDAATRKIRAFGVDTYLDGPEDPVRLNAVFSSLADGTNFVEQTVLDVKARSIQVKTTNFGHQKAGP